MSLHSVLHTLSVTQGLAAAAVVLSLLALAAVLGLYFRRPAATDLTPLADELAALKGSLAPAPAAPTPAPAPADPAVASRLEQARAALAAALGDRRPAATELAGLAAQVAELAEAAAGRLNQPLPAPESPAEQPAAEAGEPGVVETLLARGDLASTRVGATLKNAAELPNAVLTAIARGDGETFVRGRAAELDQGLYGRYDATAIRAELPELSEAEAAEVAEWLRERQAEAVAALAAQGLRRVATSVGSPFEPGRVVLDPDEPPKPTDRRELDRRVAGVRPGRGGYELSGRLVCPTRAQPYVYRAEG